MVYRSHKGRYKMNVDTWLFYLFQEKIKFIVIQWNTFYYSTLNYLLLLPPGSIFLNSQLYLNMATN